MTLWWDVGEEGYVGFTQGVTDTGEWTRSKLDSLERRVAIHLVDLKRVPVSRKLWLRFQQCEGGTGSRGPLPQQALEDSRYVHRKKGGLNGAFRQRVCRVVKAQVRGALLEVGSEEARWGRPIEKFTS